MRHISMAVVPVVILSILFPIVSAEPQAAAAVPVITSPATLSAQQSQTISIKNFAFAPANLTVAPGTTVTWTNNDTTAHTVTADSGKGPNSSQIMPGASYSFTFQQARTYPYHCTIHPQMKATVTVASSSSSSSSAQAQAQSSGGAQPQPSAPSSSSSASSSTTQQPTGPSQVAAGPVAAGGGSMARNSAAAPMAAGAALLGLAAVLLAMRRALHLSSS